MIDPCVIDGFRRLSETLDAVTVGQVLDPNKVDVRTARTPEALDFAVKFHEERLARLAAEYAANLVENLSASPCEKPPSG